MLATIALIVATALVLMTAAFNAVLRHSPRRRRYESCAARAAAALATVRVTDGGCAVSEAPDDEAIDAQIWIFDRTVAWRRHARLAPLDQRGVRPGRRRRRRTVDAFDTRLYVTPIVTHGVRTGTLVAGVGLRAYQQTARTALLGSIAFALLLFGLVLVASRWLLRRSLQPVAEMTGAAADWSEHDPDRRFAQGEPHDELTEPGSDARRPARAPRRSACSASSASRPRCHTSCAPRSRASRPRSSSRSHASARRPSIARRSRRSAEARSR